MQAAIHKRTMVIAKPRTGCCIAFIITSVLFPAFLTAADPPGDLARRVAASETRNREARGHYTYRQTVTVEEFDKRGVRSGEFREIRDIIFSPSGERTEQTIGSPVHQLVRLKLTEEDFRDIREVQPFLFTEDERWAYQVRYRGEEDMEGVNCWVLEVSPRQTLEGQRLFEGLLWVNQSDYSVVRSEGKAVPDILGTKSENLFPRFTTVRERIDGQHSFPIYTYAEDTLTFRSGPLRMRMKIQYSDYKRFGVESSITFEKPK